MHSNDYQCSIFFWWIVLKNNFTFRIKKSPIRFEDTLYLFSSHKNGNIECELVSESRQPQTYQQMSP